jgi:hypothetical protein
MGGVLWRITVMPRSPSLQAENRLKEITPKLMYYAHEVRYSNYRVIEAKKKLDSAEKENIEATKKYQTIQAIVDKMAMDSEGIFPWGLPKSITIKEFKAICPEADIPETDLIAEQNRFDKADEEVGE